jgi:hypothetical protein
MHSAAAAATSNNTRTAGGSIGQQGRVSRWLKLSLFYFFSSFTGISKTA